MSRAFARIGLVGFAGILCLCVAFAEVLVGRTGSAAGDDWQSSWLDIKPPITFKKGETLRLKIEGDAENVLVRLLPEQSDPTSPDGIEGGVRKVPADRVLVVALTRDHPNVKQVSVHAGHLAFDQSLGPKNGRVRLTSVERGNK